MNRRLDGYGGALAVVVVAIAIAGLVFGAALVSWIMMATFFAILVRPFQNWLLRRGVPGGLALLLVALLLLGVIAALAALVGVAVSQLLANMSTYEGHLADRLSELPALSEVVNPSVVIAGFVAFLRGIIGVVFDLFYMLLLVLFLLIDGPGLMARMRAGLGEDHPLGVRLSQMGPKVVLYFGLRAYLNLLTGAGVAAALWLLGIDYALLWGTLLFFFSFVPYIGIFLATIPPTLLALAEYGLGRALLVVVGITVINLMLENVLMPRMVGTNLSIAPSVVLVSFFFWTALLGPSGALLSVFATMLMIVMLDSFEPTRWLATVMTGGGADTADAVEPVPAAAVDGQTVA